MKSHVLMLLLLGSLDLGCSTQVPLAITGQKCEFDEQCKQPLLCKCVRRRNPDDEGPDEILAPGTCQAREYACAPDGGTVDDGGATVDTGASTDSASPDANLGDTNPGDASTTESGSGDADDSG